MGNDDDQWQQAPQRLSHLASRHDEDELHDDELEREATEANFNDRPVAADPQGRPRKDAAPTRKLLKQRTPSEERLYRKMLLNKRKAKAQKTDDGSITKGDSKAQAGSNASCCAQPADCSIF